MFTEQDRDRVYNEVLRWARSDPRVAAAAVVGSLATRPGDRWSIWIWRLGSRITRRFKRCSTPGQSGWQHPLMPQPCSTCQTRAPSIECFCFGCLQLDLSFAPASQFGTIGAHFRLLFGTAISNPHVGPPSARDLFGYAVHHAVRARTCIERNRLWQAEYWISSLRDNALSLACRRLGLSTHYGRGFDDLPAELRRNATGALVRALEPGDLARALQCAVDVLLSESSEASDLPAQVEARLRQFIERRTLSA
jgi:hypothetical protein